MSDVRHRLLALHFDDVTCAISASEIVAIEQDGPRARLTIEGPLLDLSDYIACTSSAPPLRLVLAGYRKAFRARARLELVETSMLYRMPRVVTNGGCAPWLRGIALLDQWSSDHTGADGKRLALWLDLNRLADASERTEMKQKEMCR